MILSDEFIALLRLRRSVFHHSFDFEPRGCVFHFLASHQTRQLFPFQFHPRPSPPLGAGAGAASASASSSMASSDCNCKGLAIVIMGVSGSGKSTIGGMLAKTISCVFLDADDFHPQENKDKMRKGMALSEEDRIPWLEVLCDTLQKYVRNRESVVLGCSALKKKYRDMLRAADPTYKPGMYHTCELKFVWLDAPAEVIAGRLERRAKEGNHFMHASLLQSQIDLLQVESVEGVIRVDATCSPDNILDEIHRRIF